MAHSITTHHDADLGRGASATEDGNDPGEPLRRDPPTQVDLHVRVRNVGLDLDLRGVKEDRRQS